MKTLYSAQTAFLFVLFMLAMAACSSSLSYKEAMQKNQNRIEDPERFEDARFLVEAKSYNLLATALTEAAINSGYAATVVELAKESQEKHTEMGKELKKLARQEKIVLPSTMNVEHQALLGELTSSDRKDFDKTFIRVFKKVSEEDNGTFMRMATDATDEDVRAFAARKLDLFKSNQTELETVDADLLKTY